MHISNFDTVPWNISIFDTAGKFDTIWRRLAFRFLIKDNYNKAVRPVNLLGKRTLKKLQLVLVCWYCEKVSFRINDTWQGRGWGSGGWRVARGHGSDLNPVPLWWGYSLYKRVACFTKWATATPVSSYFLMLLLCSWRQRFWSKTGNCWVTFPGGDQVVLGGLPNQSVLTWESDSAINFEWCVYKLQLTNLT